MLQRKIRRQRAKIRSFPPDVVIAAWRSSSRFSVHQEALHLQPAWRGVGAAALLLDPGCGGAGLPVSPITWVAPRCS
jgi:hypothetical protein